MPELRLKDDSVAQRVTVQQLFNHTAGWVGDHFLDTGFGDDALARYVDSMADLEQRSPLGSIASYNNASFGLAGRVIEKVTQTTYEAALKELVLEPLGLHESYLFPWEVMTHRFVSGHVEQRQELQVARPWHLPRCSNPAGGLVCTARDQLGYASFHLGDGTAGGTGRRGRHRVAAAQRPGRASGRPRRVHAWAGSLVRHGSRAELRYRGPHQLD